MKVSRLLFLHHHFKDRLSTLNTIVLDTMHDTLFLFRLMVFIVRDIKVVVDGGGCTASFPERRLKRLCCY
jgi:hypothetical protein